MLQLLDDKVYLYVYAIFHKHNLLPKMVSICYDISFALFLSLPSRACRIQDYLSSNSLKK